VCVRACVRVCVIYVMYNSFIAHYTGKYTLHQRCSIKQLSSHIHPRRLHGNRGRYADNIY